MRTDYDTLMDDFASRANIGNLANAERAAIETLLTFGEYISSTEADALGVVLPGALGDAVTEFRTESPDDPSVERFVSQVAERQGFGTQPTEALGHTRAILAAIAAHGGHEELQRTRDQLPDEFERLFELAELAG